MRSIGAYDAKTNFSRLLEEVVQGETITITRNGIPVAVVTPAAGGRVYSVEDAIAGLERWRHGRSLDGVTLRELIDEGRR